MKLGELGELNRGKSRHRPRDAAFLYGGSYPFIQTGDIKASRGKIISHSQTYSEAGLAQSRLWPKDTMVITIAANIAETAILDYPACFPDSVVGFIANPHKADVRFVEYAFRLLKKRIQHENVGTGSVQDNINLEILNRLEILVPELAEQKAVASILSALDDKIELNHEMNETLEAMARAIFKDWFVDFGPTRAKMAGAKPYLAQEIWNLFPDRLDDESKPAGWPSIPMENVTRRITKGTTPTASEMKLTPALDNIVNFIRVNSLNDRGQIILEKLEHIPETVHLGALKRSILQEDDILYSIAGTIGRVAMVSKEILPANTNQALAIIRPETTKVPSRFLLMVLREEFFVDALHANIVQAVQANLSLSMISSAKLVVPPAHDLFTLFSPAESLIRRIEANNQESEVLSATRDALLPKLLSGEIRVNEAEKIAEHTLARAS